MKKQGKKILIGVLITILIGGLIFVFILNSCNQSNSINESKSTSVSWSEDDFYNDENKLLDKELVVENTESGAEEKIIIEEQKKENIKQEEAIVVNKETTTDNTASIIDKNETINKNETNKEQNNSQTQRNDQNTNVEEVQKENKEPTIPHVQNKETEEKGEVNNKEAPEEEKTNNNQPTNEIKPEIKEETKEEIKEEIHSYKYNATMTEQIKQDILNNESEYMKQYGYTIEIDKSIVDLTSQFTYTSERVKSKIVKKFGTIRIYARDYYYNGNYIFTECYII